jgi:hypothetical protein
VIIGEVVKKLTLGDIQKQTVCWLKKPKNTDR